MAYHFGRLVEQTMALVPVPLVVAVALRLVVLLLVLMMLLLSSKHEFHYKIYHCIPMF